VDIVMTLLNRRPVGVERAFFHRLPVNGRGFFDEGLRMNHMRASMDAMSFPFARGLAFPGMPPSPPPNVVPAEGKFGLQKYRWKPTKQDWNGLRDTLQAIVNKRL
jgi:hypothetical protein